MSHTGQGLLVFNGFMGLGDIEKICEQHPLKSIKMIMINIISCLANNNNNNDNLHLSFTYQLFLELSATSSKLLSVDRDNSVVIYWLFILSNYYFQS